MFSVHRVLLNFSRLLELLTLIIPSSLNLCRVLLRIIVFIISRPTCWHNFCSSIFLASGASCCEDESKSSFLILSSSWNHFIYLPYFLNIVLLHSSSYNLLCPNQMDTFFALFLTLKFTFLFSLTPLHFSSYPCSKLFISFRKSTFQELVSFNSLC